jgi:hypothetical protein
MLPDDAVVADSFRSGQLDKFGVQHFQHRRSNQAELRRGSDPTKGDGWQDVVVETSTPAGRKPFEFDGEYQNQHDADPKGGSACPKRANPLPR